MSGQPNIEQVLDKFRQFLEERRRLGKPLSPRGPIISSDSTIRSYYQKAKHFLLNVASIYGLPPPEDAVRGYFALLRRRGLKPRSLLVRYCAIKNLYAAMGWPWSIEWREITPEGIERLSSAPYLKREEIDKVLAYAEERAKSGSFIELRNLVIAYLIFYGLRPEDVSRLKVENISTKMVKLGDQEDGESYEAVVITYTPCKRGRQTVKILNRRASTWLQRWIGYLESIFSRNELPFAPLIPSFRTKNPPNIRSEEKKRKIRLLKPLGYKQIYRIIRELIIEALGYEACERACPYAIRRGIVSHLLETGKASIEDVTRFFGWRSPTMPTIYDKRHGVEIAEKFIDL